MSKSPVTVNDNFSEIKSTEYLPWVYVAVAPVDNLVAYRVAHSDVADHSIDFDLENVVAFLDSVPLVAFADGKT